MNVTNRIFGALLLTSPLAIHPANAVESQWSPSERAERELMALFDAVADGAGDGAYQLATQLIESYPNFQLAQLIYGDLLSARGMNSTSFDDPRKREIDKLRDEAIARLSFKPQIEEGLIAGNLVQLSENYRYALVFELENARLYLFENNNGTPILSEHYYTSIGKAGIGKELEGDNKTPVGVYRITSFLADENLPELYGAGAYPINYPNTWDRLNGRTGHGIWLHGVPRSTYSRPPLDSEGCMVVSNVNLEHIGSKIDLSHTPVVLARSIEWQHPDDVAALRDKLSSRFEQWREDWSTLDVDAYLQHYSPDFTNQKHTYESWSAHKRNVSLGKTYIDVSTDEVDIFLYPRDSSDEKLAIVQFVQNYRSNNFNSVSRKQQFWRQEHDGKWRIIYEGT